MPAGGKRSASVFLNFEILRGNLIASSSGAVDLRSAFPVRREHIERRRIGHRHLAVAAGNLDVDAPESSLARIGTDPSEGGRQDEGLPGSKLDALTRLWSLDVR